MKKLITAALAAIALAAIVPTAVFAADPVNPVPGALCNLYLVSRNLKNSDEAFPEIPSRLTFVETASNFQPARRNDKIDTDCGIWIGWLKNTKSGGTYTFLCNSEYNYLQYSIWINGQKVADVAHGQKVFNVELKAGFNSVKVVVVCDGNYSLSISYKKAGSMKEYVPFGPNDMFCEVEEEED